MENGNSRGRQKREERQRRETRGETETRDQRSESRVIRASEKHDQKECSEPECQIPDLEIMC